MHIGVLAYWRETSVIIRSVSSGLRGAKKTKKQKVKNPKPSLQNVGKA